MSQVGTMITGAGVETVINENYVPQFILVGTTDTDLPVRKLSVSIAGQAFQQATNIALIQAWAKLNQGALLGADVKIAQVIPVANGQIPDTKIQVGLTNDGATTPAVYFYSRNYGNDGFLLGQEEIQNLSNQTFQNFSHLIFDAATLDYAQIVYNDGLAVKYTPAELLSLFAQDNNTDADGKMAGMTIIEQDGFMNSVTLFTSGGVLSVLTALTG